MRLCDKRSAPCFLGFLDLREQAVVRQAMASFPAEQWALVGGYEEAERSVLAVFPSYFTVDDLELPFCAVGFRYRPTKALTHRDFLGTLLSLGIRRDKIGDILCGSGLSVVFLRREIAPFVCEQVEKIGGEGVTVLPDYDGELPLAREYMELRETVASPRLDAIVKALLHCSREDAAQLVRNGAVSVDHLPTENVSAQLAAPCTVSVRGSGRFLIDQIGPETKKGRLNLLARKCV
ncbi:MAG: hypothetical protein IJO76_06885 [Clostridia bacterium]|nr:hypothetical protein [Clostridia bacterium]